MVDLVTGKTYLDYSSCVISYLVFPMMVRSGCRCSSGSHGSGQVVTWTGVLGARRTALGVKLDWAYSPGEFKVLVSSDGSNFEEAKCWQPAARGEVAYAESIMFDVPTTVKAVAISMRSPLSWGYFGLNSVVLLAKPGPFMLVR